MTLTELSYYFRKIAPFAILGCIVVFILYYSVQLLILLTQLKGPTVEEQKLVINTAFGPIPKPIIGEGTSSAGFQMTLDTIDGVPIVASPTANVYFLPKSPARFGFRENVYVMAKNLGIDTAFTDFKLNGDIATFTDTANKLSVNITNYNFDYEYNMLKSETERLSNSTIPSEKAISEKAVELFSKIGRYPAELARGKTNIVYLAYNPESEALTVVDSPDNANMVEVDFYRADISELPVVSPRYFNSQNYVILLFGDTDYKVVKAKVSFYEKSEEQTGIYPLKTGQQAWEDFSNGKGTVVSFSPGASQISVKKMYLAYFDPAIQQDYLQPVFVFLGDNNFAGYLPAIDDEFLKEATPVATMTPEPTIESTESANVLPTVPPALPTESSSSGNTSGSGTLRPTSRPATTGSATPRIVTLTPVPPTGSIPQGAL